MEYIKLASMLISLAFFVSSLFSYYRGDIAKATYFTVLAIFAAP